MPSRRQDWLLGRWTAKRALGPCLGTPAAPLPPGRIEIRAAEDGAPEPFVDGAPVPWTISLSHRAGRGLCAVAPGAAVLGCDLECIEPRDAGLVADFFAPAEQALVRAAAPPDRVRLVALLWSAKESVLKALRAGLREDPRDVVITPGATRPDAPWHPLTAVHAPSGRDFAGWWCDAGGWVFTLIAAAPPRHDAIRRNPA
jgi:4'-phosphopantetheinyl transferase